MKRQHKMTLRWLRPAKLAPNVVEIKRKLRLLPDLTLHYRSLDHPGSPSRFLDLCVTVRWLCWGIAWAWLISTPRGWEESRYWIGREDALAKKVAEVEAAVDRIDRAENKRIRKMTQRATARALS